MDDVFILVAMGFAVFALVAFAVARAVEHEAEKMMINMSRWRKRKDE